MDLLRRKRQSSAQSLHAMALDSQDSSSPAESSPASSIHEISRRGSGFFTTVKRSLSRASTSAQTGLTEPSTTPGAAGTPRSPSRRVLHKHAGSFSSTDSMRRRSSVASESYRRMSRAYSMSLSSSRLPVTGIDFKTAIDWRSQQVEAHCALEADPQVRSKPSYLVVTSDYIVKMRSRAEALVAFPQIEPGSTGRDNGVGTVVTPEPVLVVPVHMIVSVFLAESSRPSFGIEIWWRSATCRAAYCSTQAFFGMPRDRSNMLNTIVAQLKAKNQEFPEASLVPLEVEAQLVKIFAEEEPGFTTCKPEIFPVVRRMSVREDVLSKEKARKPQEGSSWFLALGRNSCYLAEVGPGLPVEVNCQSFGLVTLDAFRANWTFHEERFVLSFREPFKPAVTLELASKYYRQIVITFMKADRFLKPCWPTTLQTMEVFRVSGLADPQLLIAGDNYGGLNRTLDAFLAAYHCAPVDWEINWKTALAPEFRLLPAKTGGSYTNLQLLAVMRSLRFNGYFNSISFNGVDLSGLWEKMDTAGRTAVPYMNRSCLALSEDELGHVRVGSLLHQEIHALAFCSESIRQIDLSNCFAEKNVRKRMLSGTSGPGFLFPILNLLELGLTKCNRLLLSGNYLRPSDIDALVEALMTQQVEIQALDISNCGLSDLALRDIFEVLYHQGHSLQSLNMSGNCGRAHASLVANLAESIYDLRSLDMSDIIMGDTPGPLFSFETLSRFENLEELNLSRYKINDATLNALERFLVQKSLTLDTHQSGHFDPQGETLTPSSTFRKLALNNCGINGREAARLARALAHHPMAHLHLNGNPLEDGIDDLCRALALTPGPAGLHMDMVEFRHETNFVSLIKALTANRHIAFLSMAGTAPTPMADGPCGPEVCEALEAFFEGNTSVRFLDLSGYSGKLDDGQLAKGFARSLRGLTSNQTLTHLRIRNQNLHDDVGTLGVVIRQNSTLRMLDCQDNSWNLTSVQFLSKSLKLNKSIVEFPFPQTEHERVWRRVATDIRRQSVVGKVPVTTQNAQDGVLRAALQRQVQELRATVQRNREALETGVPLAVDFEEAGQMTGGENGWPSLELRIPNYGSGVKTSAKSGSRLTPIHRRSALRIQQPTSSPERMLDLQLDADLMITPVDAPPATQITRRVHEVPGTDEPSSNDFKPPSGVMRGDAALNPYHVGADPATLLLLETPPGGQSPHDGAGQAGGSSSPTEPEMPVTPPGLMSGVDSGNEGHGSEDEASSPGLVIGGGVSGSPRTSSYSSNFDIGPYFSGKGRDFSLNRFRIGSLEAHVEE